MDMEYGERLKYARKTLRGINSQDTLAEMSGVKQGLISKIERGDQLTPSSFDIDLCKALQINPFWLRFGDQPIELHDLTTGSHPEPYGRIRLEAVEFANKAMGIHLGAKDMETMTDEIREDLFNDLYEIGLIDLEAGRRPDPQSGAIAKVIKLHR